MADSVLRAGINLSRRLPPRDVHANLSGMCAIRPELTEEFLQRVDQPLQTRVCTTTGRRYLLCDYSRDGDSWRSPWSNSYEPPLADGFMPAPALREIEVTANEVFDAYREAYYEASSDSVSSVYAWELGSDPSAFASCWLIKKEISKGRSVDKGEWDSIHVVEVTPVGGADKAAFKYKITSTVLLSILLEKPDTVGKMDLSGSLTKQAAAVHTVTPARGHVSIIGAMIEGVEGDMRTSLEALYVSKTREIVSTLHVCSDSAAATAAGASGRGFVADLAAAVKLKGSK